METETAISTLQLPGDLSILTLSAPYLSSTQASNTTMRSSASSANSTRDNATPAILSADLSHYRDLFSKLRFSYVEQVTKERFLRSITAAQPEFVDAAENTRLEEELKGEKAALKERKEEVRGIVRDLEQQGRLLASRYEQISLQKTRLDNLPAEIAQLENAIAHLRAIAKPKSDNPELCMPLQPTLDLLQDRKHQLNEIDAEIEALQAALPPKRQQVDALRAEVDILNARKLKAVEEAQEARRRREGGSGAGDELEDRGRWLRGVEAGLRTMLAA